MLEMANQPSTVLGMVTRLLPTAGMGKIPTTMATVMRTLCAAIDMNGTTAIGGNNTVVIVLVGGGYYYHDAGYWYPAWGYDSNYERYDYDGPIYTYGNLLPDQVIINVQRALQQLGYYTGDLNGSLGVATRQALTAYQQDYGLDATGIVDEATVRSLGLI